MANALLKTISVTLCAGSLCLALLPSSAPAQQLAAPAFDPGSGTSSRALADGVPSPSITELSKTEAASSRPPAVVSEPPDFRALGYASLAEMETSVRRGFAISNERPVTLSRRVVEGKTVISIAAGPPSTLPE